MNMPIRAPEGAPLLSPFATGSSGTNLCDHITPRRRQTTLTEKLLLFGGAIQLAGQVKAKRDGVNPFRLDGHRARARDFRCYLGDDLRV